MIQFKEGAGLRRQGAQCVLSFYRLDGTADRGAFQLSGDFRLVSITPSQCAAPTGLRRLFG